MILGFSRLPSTLDEWALWAFSHAAHHRDIIRVIFRDYSRVLNEYVIDPIDRQNLSRWLGQHQVMHNQQNQVLGIDGAPLSELDLNDPDDVQQWIDKHANEHIQAGQILDLG